MGAKKTKKAAYASINEKFAHIIFSPIRIEPRIYKISLAVGKKGDGAKGGSTSLIGAVEGLNNEAYDGKDLTNAYKKFNDETLKTFKKQVSSIDIEFNIIDKLAR